MPNTPETHSIDVMTHELQQVKARLAELEQERRAARGWRSGLLVAMAVMLVGNLAWGQLVTFSPDAPALADEVNGNFTQLRTWLENKVGPVTTPEVRMRTTTANPVLVATANAASGAAIADFKNDTLTQGIGIASDGLFASGSAANQNLTLSARGTGQVRVNGNAAVTGTLDIGIELVNCNNITSGSSCVCPPGKRALGGGAFCNGNNWHVNTAYFPNSTSFAAWCEDSSGANQNVNVNVICARVL